MKHMMAVYDKLRYEKNKVYAIVYLKRRFMCMTAVSGPTKTEIQ